MKIESLRDLLAASPEPEIALDTEDEEVFVTPLYSYDEDDLPF